MEGGVLLQANSTVSSQKYATFEQCFLPFITPKFIHRDYTSCKCPESSVFWAYFHWVFDIVPSLKCLCKHIHTKFYSLVCWVFVFHTWKASSLIVQVASMSLSLYQHNHFWFSVVHIQQSCHSSIKPPQSLQLFALSVLLRRMEEMGICQRQIESLSKHPLPTFASK